MVISHRGRIGKKATGGLYKSFRGKKLFERGSAPTLTALAPKQALKKVRTKGSGEKTRVLRVITVNLFDPKTKKFSPANIKTVTGNSANSQFVRRNIVNKGAVIETDKGKARITSRPGQNGSVNAVLVA